MTRKIRTTKKAAVAKTTRLPKIDTAKALEAARVNARKALDAGLEAAATVRQSAVGAFDALVKQGAAIEAASRKAAINKMRKTRKAAMDQVNEAKEATIARAEEAKAKTVEVVTHLEKVFEQRVSKAISKLGVPTTKDVRALSRQVAQLQSSVESLRRSRARAAA